MGAQERGARDRSPPRPTERKVSTVKRTTKKVVGFAGACGEGTSVPYILDEEKEQF